MKVKKNAKMTVNKYNSTLTLNIRKSRVRVRVRVRAVIGKSSKSVQCTMLKACDACADMGQL